MRYADLAAASAVVGASASRTRTTAGLADALRAAGPEKVALAVLHLSGEPRQRRTGWGTVG